MTTQRGDTSRTQPPVYQRVRATAADIVVEDVRDRILAGEFEHGERIPSEKELAAYYEVSPPTIREATRALKAMKLIDVRAGSGTFVVASAAELISEALASAIRLDNIDFHQLMDVVESISVGAARSAVLRGDPVPPELRTAASGWEPGMSNEELASGLRRFISELAGLSGNSLAASVAGYLAQSGTMLIAEQSGANPTAWTANAERLTSVRLGIIDALETHDLAAAEAAVRGYFDQARKLYDSI